MTKIFFIIFILLVNNHYLYSSQYFNSKISAIRKPKNIYYKNQPIGKNIEITIYEGAGELYSIYFLNDGSNYIKMHEIGLAKRSERFNFIIDKYEDLEKEEIYDKKILISAKDKEIEDLFKDVTYEMEIYINGEEYKYICGYKISNFYVIDDKGEKIFDKNAIDYISRNSNEIKALLNLWICNKSEGSYFGIDITKEECKDYEYKAEYFPCTEIEDFVLIECDYWKLSKNRKFIEKLKQDVVLKSDIR